MRLTALTGTSDKETRVLREYAEFWKIPYTLSSEDKAQTAFVTSGVFLSMGKVDNPIIITPTRNEAERTAAKLGLGLSISRAHLSLPVAKGVEVAIETDILNFSGPELEPILKSGDLALLSKISGTRYLSSIDLVGEYCARVYQGFQENPSWRFRLATRLPFSYQSIPRFVRDRAFRASNSLDQLSNENLGPVEFLRNLFLASLLLVHGPIPRVRFWKRGKSYALALSHDVETADGLETGAKRLLNVERDLGLKSTWNIPSHRYPIPPGSLRAFEGVGEIGGHDTQHDGRLVLIATELQTKRLRLCRDRLEQLSESRVRGFRAPLLQHSSGLASATKSAGFEFDSSCPSYEILSPTSMRPHGVGTVFPFEMNGVLEIPVSLPQDHQLIRVSGQSPAESVDILLSLSKWIRSIGGPCVLLVHPDYELAQEENLPEYSRLLQAFASDERCQLMTLGDLNDWWKIRGHARWKMLDGKPTLISDDTQGTSFRLEPELVTGYGPDGFTVETLS